MKVFHTFGALLGSSLPAGAWASDSSVLFGLEQLTPAGYAPWLFLLLLAALAASFTIASSWPAPRHGQMVLLSRSYGIRLLLAFGLALCVLLPAALVALFP
jgi:hypothetical protein